jgi:DNA-binding transcriptional ArsR family regulator
MQDAIQVTRVFRALSVESRLRMLQLLRGRTLCVGALAVHLGVSSAAVSQHLRILRDLSLVEAQRRGNRVHYALNEVTLAKWKAAVAEALAVEPKRRGRARQSRSAITRRAR